MGHSGGPVGYVGMPCCHGFGSAFYAGQRLRFVVIDRLGSDLEKFFQGGEKPFPLVTVLRVAVQVLDALEFIHSKSYVHNDVKAQNLLLGFAPEQANSVYLVDFGLACKYRCVGSVSYPLCCRKPKNLFSFTLFFPTP